MNEQDRLAMEQDAPKGRTPLRYNVFVEDNPFAVCHVDADSLYDALLAAAKKLGRPVREIRNIEPNTRYNISILLGEDPNHA